MRSSTYETTNALGGFCMKAFIDKRSLNVSGPMSLVGRYREQRGRRWRGVSICFTGSYRPLCYAGVVRREVGPGNRGVSCCGIGRLGYLGNHIKVWVALPSTLLSRLFRYDGCSRVYLSDKEVSSGLVQLAFDIRLPLVEQMLNEFQTWSCREKTLLTIREYRF